eukprot:COSAG02_NODE_195_length_29750_cov_79.793329_31_plen_764_part_00
MAMGEGSGGQSPTPRAAEPAANSEDVDMEQLMAEISRKLARADEALRAKAEAEKQSKIQAEALLSVYRSVSKDQDTATRAIVKACRNMLNAELVAMYFMRDMVHKPKKLQLLPHGVEAIGYEDDTDPQIYEEDMQIELESGYVGRVAQEDVRSREDRTVAATPDEVIVGSDAIRENPRAVWDSSHTLKPSGPDAPAGFEPKSTLVSAVQYMAPSKSMVTQKSEVELRKVFEDADTDKGGSLDRDEINALAVKLGKRLSRKELDEAMQDMDEDGSNEVDFDEFSQWWQDSVKKIELGNVVGVVQAINKVDGPSFDKKDAKQLRIFLDEISYMINEIAEKTNLAYAAEDYEQLDEFQDAASRNRLAKLRPSTRAITIGTASPQSTTTPLAGASGNTVMAEFSIDNLQPAAPSRVLAGLSLPSIEELQQWSFPVLNYSMEQLVGSVVLVFHERGFMQNCKLTEEIVSTFAAKIFSQYNEVPYHNMWHGFGVFQGCYWAMSKCPEVRKGLGNMDQFALLVAALCHDTNHDGVNNAFHMNSYDELALTYNDTSLLESMHARKCFETSRLPGCEIFGGLEKDEFKLVRSTIISCIIQTDMTFHGVKMKKLDEKSSFSVEDPEDKKFWLEAILHGLDIANAAWPWDECSRWARMVCTEFKMQVAKEKANGLPVSGFMDIGDNIFDEVYLPNVAKSQIGFGNFVVKGCLQKMANHIPVFAELVEFLDVNTQNWKDIADPEADPAKVALPPPSGNELICMNYAKEILTGTAA